MKKDNVWYYKMGSDLEKSTIKYFKSNGYWDTVIWNDAEFKHYRYNDKEIEEKYNQHEYVRVPEEIYDHVYKHLYTYIDMYLRLTRNAINIYDNKNIYDYVNIFNRDLNFIYQMLIENDINLVIFPRSPHLGGDMILYLLAEKMGLRTLILEHSKFTNKFFFYYDVWDYGEFKTSNKIAEFQHVKVENKFEKDLYYMKDFYKKNKPSLRTVLRDWFRPEYRLIVESFKPGGIDQSLSRYKMRKKFKNDSENTIDENIDLEKKFIYFPLHLQPEKTTSAFGGKYVDQLLALERLSQRLPDGWYIYVKENPMQNFYMRGSYFFERFNSIPGLKMVPGSMNTYELIEKSELVATVTGTAGWEAITGGKPAVVFGWGVWYKTFPGIFQYHEEIDLEEIANHKFDHKLLEEKVSELQTRMGEGVIYERLHKSYPDYNKLENEQTVNRSLKQILYDTAEN